MQPLLRLLRRRCAAVDVLLPSWSAGVAQRMPELRRILPAPWDHGQLLLRRRWRLAQQLRSGVGDEAQTPGKTAQKHSYSWALVLPNSFKSALVPWLARVPRRTGWRGEMRHALLNDLRTPDWQRYPRMVDRFAALALDPQEPLPSLKPPRLRADEQRGRRILHAAGLDARRPLLALCPGAAFGAVKCWPVQHYAALGRVLLERGWQLCILGSAADALRSGELRARLPAALRKGCCDLAGRGSLEDAIDVLSIAQAAVSNDSGLMHIAAAVSCPLIALYGSTSPSFTPPLGPRTRTLSIKVDCGPCFRKHCVQRGPDYLKCLYGLAPQRVLEALQQLVPETAQST